MFVWLRARFFEGFVGTVCILSVASAWVWAKHVEAEAFLDRIDFDARPVSGSIFYAAPKHLSVGQRVSISSIVDHLKRIGFVSAADLQPGSYVVADARTLSITPRLPEFRPVRIAFQGARIGSLLVQDPEQYGQPDFRAVRETTIEPESLGSFILSLDGPKQSRMFVRRRVIQFDAFADTPLFHALLASEDETFMYHHGIRFDRMLRSMLPRGIGGGSTLTAQFVKNAVSLDRTHTFQRKIDEMFLASSLEERMSKPQILTGYVNHTFLGGGSGLPNVYGFAAAAEEYFGKTQVRELSLAEAGTLVAMLPRPNAFLQSVRAGDYRQLHAARNRVLARVRKVWPQKYSESTIMQAQLEKTTFRDRTPVLQPLDTIARPFVDFASQGSSMQELEGLTPDQLAGAHVFTSLDPDLTRSAQTILDAEIPGIRRRFPPSKSGSCAANDDRLLGSIVALDPHSGQVVVMSGSGGGKDGIQFANFALNALASPASTMKPFSTVLALKKSGEGSAPDYTAATLIPAPSPTRVRAALSRSSEQLAYFNIDRIGLDPLVRLFELSTGSSVPNPTREFALGFGAGTEVSALRYARAYSIFAHGSVPEAVAINAVYIDGKPLQRRAASLVRVVDPGAAYVTAQMMRSVLGYGIDGIHGTARHAAEMAGLSVDRMEIAGKTGSGPHAVWMMSVSPQLVIAVQLTYKCHSEIANAKTMFAADTAAIIWAKFVRSIREIRPDLLQGTFLRPANVVEEKIDPARGCLSKESNSMFEYFLAENAPRPCSINP